MAEKYDSIYQVLNDPNGDRALQRSVLETLKPLHQRYESLSNSFGNPDHTPIYRRCQQLNHCPTVSAQDRSIYGGTTAPAFNIYGPSGKQSLSQFRFFSHSGKVVFEGVKASGQFSVDVIKGVAKNAARNVVKETLKDVLKDEAKDEIKTALFDPTNYAMVSIMGSKPHKNRQRYRERFFVYVGQTKTVFVPDHQLVTVNMRVDPTMPMLWRMSVQAADYINRY